MDIQLRSITLDDIEMVRNWRNSAEVAPYMYTSTEITAEQQLEWYDKIINDLSCRYWIILYEDKPLGLASVTGINKTFSSCYWAFYLGDTNNRGSGIGAKVEYNVIEFVFNELQMNKLRCEVITFNDKVIQMHEKFGFRREAFYRQHVLKDGKFLDVVGLALLKQEWQQIRETMRSKIYKN
jgi:UDP-4-amino-4,6-dideoxy-N-acetyl-beta-L-altrosamine N-acetyltransferase